jgi:signal transduction histidine kinase
VIRDGLHATADPQLLRIALENLLGNAWKFTKNAEDPRIEFNAADAGSGVFYVRDNGAGFNSQYAKDLFVPFRRLHNASEFPGSGIGLSIVDRIIRRHGGCVEAEGSPGRGATFYFSIPEGGAGGEVMG